MRSSARRTTPRRPTGGRRPDPLATPEAREAACEMIAVGKKLWDRGYVDGNGGNLSCRLPGDLVLCSPTLLSKADLTPECLCVLDLNGRQVAGTRSATSETLLHLAITRKVPAARAVVHCHPPHATAYAIAGKLPPLRLIPEYEVFVGPMAMAPYHTPGTAPFAEGAAVPARTTTRSCSRTTGSSAGPIR